jgi:cytochrome c553
MSGAKRAAIAIVVLFVAAEQAWLLAPLVRRAIFPPQNDPAERGRQVAERLGCFGCHGAEGAGGIRNPGSDNQVVPALSGGEMMMWADSETELREWILFGAPRDETPGFVRDGYTAGYGSGRALVMPAYERHLVAGDLDALLAYLRAISGLQFPDAAGTKRGLELAHRLGCFRCHGPMGTGGLANPGSLKGYVPGFFGRDFTELVRDRAEARQWISAGVSDRFRDNLAARAILERQAIKMPAYGEFLPAEDVDALADLVEWLGRGEWREISVP